MENEILFSNLGELCEPKKNISDKRVKDKWCSYSYETSNFSGTMLISMPEGTAGDVELNPELSGWYKIFVGLYVPAYQAAVIDMKLTSDEAFMQLSPCLPRRFAEHIAEDVFWRCANMDNEKIIIGKHLSCGHTSLSALSWIRFVPMSKKEINGYKAEKARTDTKRLYATDDMHNHLCFRDVSDISGWKSLVINCIDSDVEWLAIENISHFNGEITDCDSGNFAFDRSIDRAFCENFKKDYSFDVLRKIVDYGQKQGIKMCVSMRVALCGFEFPSDRMCFEHKFSKENKQLRCVDRDGDVTEYLSFAYKEVQDYIIEHFVNMVNTGCDAVQLIFSRGWPYILFEKPFLEEFTQRYGEDARELPLNNERIISLKCEIMTDFIRRLRSAIDKAAGGRKIELHAKILSSLYDCRFVGLDTENWAENGLVDRFISDERRIREVLPPEVMKNDGKIDLRKYAEYERNSEKSTIVYDYSLTDSLIPYPDKDGVNHIPKNQEERVKDLMILERKYGKTVYIEIMPRVMAPDKIKEKALEIYNAGCEHLALWDTYQRNNRKCEWSMWRRLGHKQELETFENELGEFYKPVRFLKLGGKNVRSYKPLWGG